MNFHYFTVSVSVYIQLEMSVQLFGIIFISHFKPNFNVLRFQSAYAFKNRNKKLEKLMNGKWKSWKRDKIMEKD